MPNIPSAYADLFLRICVPYANIINIGQVRNEVLTVVDWKQIPKIDAHIHLLPNDVISANSGYDDPFVDNGSVNDYLTIMEAYNIECAFIMPFNDPCMLSMDFTLETVHSNLHHMATCASSKLKCFADVDIRKDITQTLEELSKVLVQKEFGNCKCKLDTRMNKNCSA